MPRFCCLLVAGLYVSLGLSARVQAVTVAELEEDCSLATKVVTPHKPWGKGWAQGPVRTLFFIYTGPHEAAWGDPGVRVREIVELQQRFDLPGEAILFCGKDPKWDFYGQHAGAARARRLLANPYDLYVFAGFPPDKLPAEIQYQVLARVVAGAGLVCTGWFKPTAMISAGRVEPLPPELAGGLAQLPLASGQQVPLAYRLGLGRGVWLNYGTTSLTPVAEPSWEQLAAYDYWQMLVGRAALWAAGREGEVAVPTVMAGTPATRAGAAPGMAELVLSSSSRESRGVSVALELRRASDGCRTPLGTVSVVLPARRETKVQVPLPRLAAGRYYVDAVVRDRRGGLAFGAGNLTVETAFGIAKVTLDPRFVEPGQTLCGRVELRGTVPPDSRLEIRLRDSYDRVQRLWQQPLDGGAAAVTFEYQADHLATTEMQVEAGLWEPAGEVDRQTAVFTVPKRRHGQFNFVMWDCARDTLGYYAWRRVQGAGYNVCLAAGSRPPHSVVMGDASLVPYATRILDSKDDKGVMKPCCWNDEAAVAKHVGAVVEKHRAWREAGVFAYSLGDEGATAGYCAHPACRAAWQRWLQDQYGGDLAILNASWHSDYASFTDIPLIDPGEEPDVDLRKSNPVRWFDRQAFARVNLARYTGVWGAAFAQLDPEANCGFEGAGKFGDDYEALCAQNRLLSPYPSIGDEVLRSIFPRDRIRANWVGYSKTGDALSDVAWRAVLLGADSVWFWMHSGIGTWRGMLRPTLDYWPATADFNAEMRPLREGLGDLILASAPRHSGIAMLYSVPSALSPALPPEYPHFIRSELAHTRWIDALHAAGLDFRYLTRERLRQGELRGEEFKVLLLPTALALSPAEVEGIRRFVEAGGMVVTDVRPGSFDEHGVTLARGSLEELFGVRCDSKGSARDHELSLPAVAGLLPQNLNLGLVRCDRGTCSDGAAVGARVDGIPLLLTQRTGAGRTILLNFQPLAAPPGSRPERDFAKLLAALCEAAGARPLVKVASPQGEPLPRTQTRAWQNGQGLLLGLRRRMECDWDTPRSRTTAGAPVSARIELSQPQHLYDLRAGKYRGLRRELDLRLRWGRASFLLALPYRIGKMSVALAPAAPQPGQPCEAALSLALPAGARECLPVYVELVAPDGTAVPWGSRPVLLRGGQATLSLRMAWNDAPGTWRLRARELFSGQSAEVAWTVSAQSIGGAPAAAPQPVEVRE